MRPSKNNASGHALRVSPSLNLDNLHRDAEWRGKHLFLYGRTIASVVPDEKWPGMWRVLLPNGYRSDMVNLTRAKDCAKSIALSQLNSAKEAA